MPMNEWTTRKTTQASDAAPAVHNGTAPTAVDEATGRVARVNIVDQQRRIVQLENELERKQEQSWLPRIPTPWD